MDEGEGGDWSTEGIIGGQLHSMTQRTKGKNARSSVLFSKLWTTSMKHFTIFKEHLMYTLTKPPNHVSNTTLMAGRVDDNGDFLNG